MGDDRVASEPNSLMMHAAQPSNAQPAWMLRWPKDLPPWIEIQAGKEMLVRIVAMLTKLLMRFDPEQYRVHESAAGLAAPFEHEYPGKAGLFWVRHEHMGVQNS
jgi:hypothetical protein